MQKRWKKNMKSVKQKVRYVMPSKKALKILKQGIESVKMKPLVYRKESFKQYADDE